MRIEDKRFYALARVLPNINEFPDEITDEDVISSPEGCYLKSVSGEYKSITFGDEWMDKGKTRYIVTTSSIERRVRYALKVVDEAIRQVTFKQ